MNKHQFNGRLTEAKGKVKEILGSVVGNKGLELKGEVQKIGGKVRALYGDFRRHLDKHG